jgi:hypothetical protein
MGFMPISGAVELSFGAPQESAGKWLFQEFAIELHRVLKKELQSD